MPPSRVDPAVEFGALRDGLADLASLVLAQVERAVAGWEEGNPSALERIAEGDREVDARSAALEERVLALHRTWPAFAQDLRLLHIGLIAAIALERVGNLAVAIARQAISRGDVEAGERAAREARAVGPMLDGVLHAVTTAGGGQEVRAWSAAAVLVARHIERVANNAAELGERVRFLVTGELAPGHDGG